MGHFQVVLCPCVKLSVMKMCSAYGFIFIQIKLFFIWKVSTRTCCKIEAQSTSEMANWAATKLLQTALSTATNSSHVCKGVSTHLTLEHPSRFCWTAPSSFSLWHLQLYCNVLVCMMVHSNDIMQPHLPPSPAFWWSPCLLFFWLPCLSSNYRVIVVYHHADTS